MNAPTAMPRRAVPRVLVAGCASPIARASKAPAGHVLLAIDADVGLDDTCEGTAFGRWQCAHRGR